MALIFALLLAVPALAQDYILGAQGQNCYDACAATMRNCDPHIATGNTADLFRQVGANCTPDARPWWAEDQPSWVVDQRDGNFGKCLGFTNVPGGVLCSTSHPAVRRVCHCAAPTQASRVGAFGTGCSQCVIPTQETTFFSYFVPTGVVGVINHFWITAPEADLIGVLFRYYIDGESTPSIAFTPSEACGAGFNEKQAPWGTKWAGKGAANGAWFFNYPIPFYKSIRITIQHPTRAVGFYWIIRGLPQQPNVPIRLGNFELPPGAKAKLVRTLNQRIPAFEYVTLVDIPQGGGMLFQHTLIVQSLDLNFLEGCYHAYTPHGQTFPGTLLSTGTEDYFDSAWYFDAGQFHFPVAGFSHITNQPGRVTFSAYRFHDMDPLVWTDGFRFQWRNGDVSSGGIKCFTDSGPGVNGAEPVLREKSYLGAPRFSESNVTTYNWLYVW